MAVASSKGLSSHQERHNGMAVNGSGMLGCDPANTFATRPIAVLEGDAAREFVERVEAMENVPDPTYPSGERLKELKEFYRKYALNKLNNGL